MLACARNGSILSALQRPVHCSGSTVCDSPLPLPRVSAQYRTLNPPPPSLFRFSSGVPYFLQHIHLPVTVVPRMRNSRNLGEGRPCHVAGRHAVRVHAGQHGARLHKMPADRYVLSCVRMMSCLLRSCRSLLVVAADALTILFADTISEPRVFSVVAGSCTYKAQSQPPISCSCAPGFGGPWCNVGMCNDGENPPPKLGPDNPPALIGVAFCSSCMVALKAFLGT